MSNTPRLSAEDSLEKVKELIKWKDFENILDVGCGNGEVTIEVLLPIIPPNFNKLIGVDISDRMINMAKERTSDPKISFDLMDIASPTIPAEFKNHFDHIFSFMTLNMVKNQSQAVHNLATMLREGGQAVLTIIANTPPFDAYVDMATSTKWAHYMTPDWDANISPYRTSEKPAEDLEEILAKEGFASHVAIEDWTYTLALPVFNQMMCALNPAVKHLPDDKTSEYKEEFLEAIRNNEKVKVTGEGADGTVHITMTIMRAVATKGQ